MNKSAAILLVISSIFLASCSPQPPQVTATSLPSTATVIPMPTSHPQFAALRDQIAASGEHFILNSNGTISDGANPIPGLIVAPDGTMTIMVNGESVILDPAKTHFDDEAGITNDEYKLDESGIWIEVITPESTEAGKATMAILEQLNVPEGVVKLEMKGESVVCIDVATREVACKNGTFVAKFVKEYVKLYGDAQSTPYGPETGNVPPGTATSDVQKHVTLPMVLDVQAQLRSENGGVDVLTLEKSAFIDHMISDQDKSWGAIITVDRFDPNSKKYFAYVKKDGELVIIPIK